MTAGTRARGPYAKTEARRADILRTALDSFAVRGFQGSSLRDIAESVGLSLTGLLHHFSSKEALLAAVLAEKDAVSLEHSGAAGPGILDALRAVVVENLAQPGLIRLFTTLSAEAINEDHPAHDYFRVRYDAARELLAAGLAQGQEDGTVDPAVDVEIAATLLLAVMDGLQVQWLLSGVDMLPAFDAFLTTFRARIAAD